MSYTPSKTALYQRKQNSSNRCQDPICKQQRVVSTVPQKLKYKLYNVCVECKTNWEKSITNCKCCGMRLRVRAHR
jgi:hypothetical protein